MRRYILMYFCLVSITCCFLLLILCGIKAKYFRIEPFQSYSEKTEPWFSDWHHRLKQGRKIILLYTTWFDHHIWLDLTGRRLYERMEHCERATNCLLTYDKSWIINASAVVFHGRDIENSGNRYWSAEKFKEVRKRVPLAQKWIYFSHENPEKDINLYRPFDRLFNWTATFSRKSNIFISYQDYEPTVIPQNGTRNYAKEKTGLVAWAVSNCRSKLRLDYVRQLQRYVNVTVYGKCNCYFARRSICKRPDTGCRKELSKHKFYLAFENDFCHDYVTEKYWERITQQDLVPVVMGSNYDGVVIPGSYIDASDFGSIRELAYYLLYLDKNDEAYNKYFSYKTTYTGGSASIFCKVCEKLNSEEAKQFSEVILSTEFNYEKTCAVNRAKLEKFQNQVDSSKKDDNQWSLTFTDVWCWFYRLLQ